jgi:hypothetical protein
LNLAIIRGGESFRQSQRYDGLSSGFTINELKDMLINLETDRAENNAGIIPSTLDMPHHYLEEIQRLLNQDVIAQTKPTYSLVGSLEIVSLQDKPKFIALSYVWGDEICKGDLLLNETKVDITQNLSSALQHFQFTDEEDTPLWIDAVRT